MARKLLVPHIPHLVALFGAVEEAFSIVGIKLTRRALASDPLSIGASGCFTYGSQCVPQGSHMLRVKNKASSFVTLFLLFAGLSQSALATPLLTPINAGYEAPVTTILDAIMKSDGISLVRVSDIKDEFWKLPGGPSTVLTRARSSAYNDIFGVIPGIDSGLNPDFDTTK